jgi:hypothetical protein
MSFHGSNATPLAGGKVESICYTRRCGGRKAHLTERRIVLLFATVDSTMKRKMPQFSIRVTKTKREFAGNRFTTIARFLIKPPEGGPALVYEGNATGDEFMDKCERLKRQPTIIDVSGLDLEIQSAWKQKLVRLALAQMTV